MVAFDLSLIEFGLDLNGKIFKWQAVVLIPFIDQTRLLDAVRSVEGLFSFEEQQRNSVGVDLLYVHSIHTGANVLDEINRQDSPFQGLFVDLLLEFIVFF